MALNTYRCSNLSNVVWEKDGFKLFVETHVMTKEIFYTIKFPSGTELNFKETDFQRVAYIFDTIVEEISRYEKN